MGSPYKQQLDEMVWSYSRITTYANCPAEFKQHYLDDPEHSVDNAFAEFGSLCHMILEEYEAGQLAEYELLDEYDSRYNEVVCHEFPKMRGTSLGDSYYNDGAAYFESFNGFPESWEILGQEIEFEVMVGPYRFRGFIDLLVRDRQDQRLIVVDHKSKNGFHSKKEKAEYAKQLYSYSKYVYEKYGEYPKQLIFNMFRKHELVTIEFSPKDYEATLHWLVAQIDEIYQDLDFWDKITKEYERKGKDIEDFACTDFYCNSLCGCRTSCERSIEYEGGGADAS